MSENNNNNENNNTENNNTENNTNKDSGTDEFTKGLNDFFNKAFKTAQDYGKKTADKIDLEKKKAEIKSKIGHNLKDISASCEQLGRGYYDFKVNQKEFADEQNLVDAIRTKEEENAQLNEQLKALGQ